MLMGTLLKKQGIHPKQIVIDRLEPYGADLSELEPEKHHKMGSQSNN